MNQPFDRIIFVMFENQYRSYVLQDAFMQKLASAGANLVNSFGVFHPSQTNYVASLTGEVCGITNDTPPAQPLLQPNLVDLLEEGNVSWKAYMEGFPGDPWNSKWKDPKYPESIQPLTEYPNDGTSLSRYFRKHNAFASVHSIQASEERWNKIVSDIQFWKDVYAKDIPDYSWFTPDIWNDGHYLYNTHVDTNPRTQLIPQLSGWLEYVFFSEIPTSKVQGFNNSGLETIGLNLDINLLLTDPDTAWKNSNVLEGTLIVVTFDEADFDAVGFDTNYDGPNQVYTILLGDMIKPGTIIDVPYNHYSLIKTVQKNYNLGTLNKNDLGANWLRFLWGETFKWSPCQSSKIENPKHIASAFSNGQNHLVIQKDDGSIWQSTLSGDEWSPLTNTGIKGGQNLTLSSVNNSLLLIYTDESGNLFYSMSQGQSNWSEPEDLNITSTGALTSTSYIDNSDNQEKVMICWTEANGFIKNLIFQDNSWEESSGDVGQLTDGPMALSHLGGSLYLVYKERNTKNMRVTSYNHAPYNSFKALNFDNTPAPLNNTSIHQWSPADMPVGNFAKKLNAEQHRYLVLGNLAMASIEGEMHLIHRDAYDDTPTALSTYFGLTGIFTAENQLTNGFGTIDQAGWTDEVQLSDIQLDPESALSMSSNGKEIIVLWAESKTKHLKWIRGSYQ